MSEINNEYLQKCIDTLEKSYQMLKCAEKVLTEIFEAYCPSAEIWAYGSRVNATPIQAEIMKGYAVIFP